MKFPAKIVACLLPVLLTGCFLQKKPKAAVQPLAPDIAKDASSLPPPSQSPPPDLTIPTKPEVAETKLPSQSPKPPAKHKKTPPPDVDAQQASGGAPAVSAIGQLSSGDPNEAKRQAQASIDATERGLKGINRTLDDTEQKTAAHIREFLKQARDALASGDVDGANTLAAKAKVLLTELQR
jgi:outer membrane biosynthesis protein TonB